MPDKDRQFQNTRGLLATLDNLVGGYFALACVFVLLWFTVLFPIALIWWAMPHLLAFVDWFGGLFG